MNINKIKITELQKFGDHGWQWKITRYNLSRSCWETREYHTDKYGYGLFSRNPHWQLTGLLQFIIRPNVSKSSAYAKIRRYFTA